IAEPPLAPGVTQATMYLRDDVSGAFLALVNETNTTPGTLFGSHVHFASATADLSHVVITSEVALTGEASFRGLYVWSGGQLEYVSVRPGGGPATAAELGFFGGLVTHAISADGTRIIWTVPEGGVETKHGHLYMRDTAKGETLQLDAAQGVAEPAKGSAQ